MPVDWRDNLLPADLGGAPFCCQEVKTSPGRRVVITELPGRSEPAHEDLGRAARRYAVTGFVIGDEYMAARDALIEVFDSEGPYEFTHPFIGMKYVVLDGTPEITESDTEGGWARITFGLVESGLEDGLRVYISSASALAAAAAAGAVAGAKDLAASLTQVNIGSIFSAAAAAIGSVSRQIMSAKRSVFGALGVPELISLNDAIGDLADAGNRLLSTPAELMTTLLSLVSTLMSVVARFDDDDPAAAPYPGGAKAVRAEAALSAAQELASVDPVTPPPYPGGPIDEDAREAQRAIGKALRVAAICGVAELLQTLPLESQAVAKEALAVVGDLVEQQLLDQSTGDELFTALTNLRAALDQHLAGLASSLPSVQKYTPPTAMPALLIAYLYYRDPTRDLEICGRNKVPDPNFVRGGVPLEVLDA